MSGRVTIFAGGEVYDYNAIRTIIDPKDYVIAVDSGYSHCQNLGIVPDILIGDFDSILHIPSGIEKLTYPTAKNYTDLYHGFEHAVTKKPGEIIVVGALGGRFDHTLSNIQIAAAFSSCGKISLVDGKTMVFVINAKNCNSFFMNGEANNYFSVIAHSDICTNVEIIGGLYPLDSYNLTNADPRGISNQFCGEVVRINLDSGILLLVVEEKD